MSIVDERSGSGVTAQWSVDRLTGSIGARVGGVDLAHLSDPDLDAVRRLLHEHSVLVFPGQRLDNDAHVELAARFGPVLARPTGDADRPEITSLDTDDTERFGRVYGNDEKSTEWHSDATWEADPPYVALLRCEICPASGGDTVWADTRSAYDGLSEPLKAMLTGLTAVHDPAAMLAYTSVEDKLAACTHPLVVTDPITGRKALYINPKYTQRIVELKASESSYVLDLLFEQLRLPEYQLRVKWEPGQVTIWHEFSTIHYAVRDYAGRRSMRRVIASAPERYRLTA